MTGTTPLRATLKQLGLTQAEFAAALGVSKDSVTRWARGKWPLPAYAQAWIDERRRAEGMRYYIMGKHLIEGDET